MGLIVTQKLGLHHIIGWRQCRDKFRESFDNMITEKPSDPSIMSFATIIFWQTYDLTLQLDSQVGALQVVISQCQDYWLALGCPLS